MALRVSEFWLLCGYSHTTARRMVLVCTSCAVQLIKCYSWWWTNDSPKHVEPFKENIKTVHKNLCISSVYIHIAIWCTVHTTSNWGMVTVNLGALEKLEKATIRFIMSVCPSAWNNLVPAGGILMKFDIKRFFSKICRENSCFEKIHVWLKSEKNEGYFE